jgi:hypothetical protein
MEESSNCYGKRLGSEVCSREKKNKARFCSGERGSQVGFEDRSNRSGRYEQLI